jgi:hypothetical protein
MNEIPNFRLLTRKEAGEYLGGICLTTLSRLNIPRVQIRRRVFYRKNDLDQWLTEHISEVRR